MDAAAAEVVVPAEWLILINAAGVEEFVFAVEFPIILLFENWLIVNVGAPLLEEDPLLSVIFPAGLIWDFVAWGMVDMLENKYNFMVISSWQQLDGLFAEN